MLAIAIPAEVFTSAGYAAAVGTISVGRMLHEFCPIKVNDDNNDTGDDSDDTSNGEPLTQEPTPAVSTARDAVCEQEATCLDQWL